MKTHIILAFFGTDPKVHIKLLKGIHHIFEFNEQDSKSLLDFLEQGGKILDTFDGLFFDLSKY